MRWREGKRTGNYGEPPPTPASLDTSFGLQNDPVRGTPFPMGICKSWGTGKHANSPELQSYWVAGYDLKPGQSAPVTAQKVSVEGVGAGALRLEGSAATD